MNLLSSSDGIRCKRWDVPNYSSQLTRTVPRPEQPLVLNAVGSTSCGELHAKPTVVSRLRKIAVALDGSPLGELAIPYALRLAKLAKADLQLMYVRKSPFARSWRQYLPAIVERLEEANVSLKESICFEGAGAVTRFCRAVDESADLVVTGSHRGVVRRLLFSSVSDRLLQTTSTPLLIVRGAIPPSDFHWSPPLRRVLIPLMGHKSQHELLETVAETGRLTSGLQTLLRILPIEIDPVASDGLKPPNHPATALSALREAESDLKQAASYLPNPHTRLIYSTSRLETTVLFDAIANEFDLVALSMRPRGRLARFLLPDVYDLLLLRTCLPLLVFREESKST